MADGGIGLASLVLAAPGLVDLAVQYGEYIAGRTRTLAHASDVLEELRKFGHSLYEGKLKLDIELANEAFATQGYGLQLKKALEDQIDQLDATLKEAKKILDRQSSQTVAGKIKLTFLGEQRLRRINKKLRNWQRDFSDSIYLVQTARKELPDELLLSQDRFEHNESMGYSSIPFTTSIFRANADYKTKKTDMSSKDISVLIERRSQTETVPESVVREIASLLSYRLAGGASDRGMLHCLGYRMTTPNAGKPTSTRTVAEKAENERSEPELIFELPDGVDNIQTLQTLIMADVGKDTGADHPLDFRFQLAREVSEAVLSVHMARLVHKNIRTETILILQSPKERHDGRSFNKTGFGKPILSSWSLLREASQITMRRGVADWAQNIYRHPRRQGLYVQDKYNLGHDVYSLGVCLLEIGLWNPLVRTRTADGNPQVSEIFRRTAKVESAEDPEVLLQRKLDNPSEVQSVLQAMAEKELPKRVGLGYMRLVVACLKCLEGGFGDSIDFEKLDSTEAAVVFKDLILASFTNISF